MSGPGVGIESFWETVSEGRTPVVAWHDSVGDLEIESPAIPAADFKADDHFSNRQVKLLDRVAQFGIVAAREAVENARLDLETRNPARVAVVIGTGCGGELTRETANHATYVTGSRVSPMTIPRVMTSAAASAVSIELSATGPVLCTSTACASSAHAIQAADMLIKSGAADIAIAGGAETLPSVGLWKAWQGLGVLAPETIRPFSLERAGFVFGEGAGVLVMESEKHAEGRGADVLCSLAGAGASSDAKDMVNPDPSGMAEAMRRSIESAGLRPEEVEYVNAHGTGTRANDAAETAALRELFAGHLENLPVSSTKSVHGHAIGASSALEVIATVLAMTKGKLPPTANFQSPDPEIAIDCIPNQSREARVDVAISNSFAFGGLNVSLVLKRA